MIRFPAIVTRIKDAEMPCLGSHAMTATIETRSLHDYCSDHLLACDRRGRP